MWRPTSFAKSIGFSLVTSRCPTESNRPGSCVRRLIVVGIRLAGDRQLHLKNEPHVRQFGAEHVAIEIIRRELGDILQCGRVIPFVRPTQASCILSGSRTNISAARRLPAASC